MSNEVTRAANENASGRDGRRHGRLHQRLHANPAIALTTKIVVTTAGVLVLGAGLVMMVTPGPGIVGILLGLALLATEYEWADRWLVAARKKAHEARQRAEEMDPRVRRRRIIVVSALTIVIVAVVTWYVVTYDWPGFAVTGWNWVQGLLGGAPELPGM